MQADQQTQQNFFREWKIKTIQQDVDIRSRLVAARLPSLPQTLLKLMEQCQSEVVGMKELLRLVAQDVAMTVKMLSVANSTAYHRGGGEGGSLELALKTIGTEMIKIIVINESVAQVFDKMSKSHGVDLRGYWSHALRAGVTARLVAQKTGYSNPDEAYLAGLLHDVGRLALFAIMPREYGHNFYATDDEDLCAVEERTLQTTHAEVGSWLIELWKLDSFIADSVLYHHEAAQRLHDAHPLIRIAHLAHTLAADVDDSELEKSAALCALSLADMQDMREEVAAEVQIAAKQMNIDLAADVQRPKPVAVVGDSTQEKMMEQVRGMMLTTALERSFSGQKGEGNVLETITRSARILFHFDSAVVLLMNPVADALVGSRSGEHRARLADFSLPLTLENSTLAEAARTREIAFTPAVSPSMCVLEEQLVRLMGTEHLACLPLTLPNGADGKCVGVLVGGFKAWQVEDIEHRRSFLTAFCNQAALALTGVAVQSADTRQQLENQAREFRDASRKVAHEINNPLAIIKNYLTILDKKLLNMQGVSGEVAVLNEEIERVGKIIDDFAELNLTEPGGRADLGRVVEDVVRLFRQTEFASPLLRIENRTLDLQHEVEGSADTLKQILVNLIKNAAEAMTGGGMIEIGSDGLVNRDKVLYVNLWVKDNGPGIGANVMSMLFSPVQTSKGRGHSGLGLNIVHDLVKKMQGLITCRSGKEGTTFEILLPAAPRANGDNDASGSA